MAATLMLACSNDKSGGHDGDEGVETEVNGTQLDGNTTLYGLVTDTSGNPIPGVVVSDGYGCVTTDANGVYQMERYKKARFVQLQHAGRVCHQHVGRQLPALLRRDRP